MRTSAVAPEAPKGATQDPTRDAPAGPRAQRPPRRVHAWWQGSEGGPGAATRAAGSDPRDEERSAPAVIRALESTGPGRALPVDIRAPLEASMGADFRDVRVHTGLEAQRLTGRFDARAFAVGRHVAFAPGAYAPHTGQGRYVLAHELAHVVQQSRGGAGSHSGEEASADRAAAAAVSGGEARVVGGAAPRVACYGSDSPLPAAPILSLTGDEPPVGAADPERQSDPELEAEVHALRAWLRRHNANSAAHHQATHRVQALERVVHERQPHAFRYGDTIVRWGIVRAAGTVVTYAAVPPGGRVLADVAAYLYGGADAVARLQRDNPNLPEQLPAGLGVRVNTSALARVARGSLEQARRNELVLLTDAVPTASDGDATTVSTTWRGRHVTLTQSQHSALLDHEAARVRFRASLLRDTINQRLTTMQRLAPHTGVELMVQEASDFVGGQQRPSEDLWLRPLGRLTAAALPRRGNRSVERIADAWRVVGRVSVELSVNVASFNEYIERTIGGAETIAFWLEVFRDGCFAAAAAMSGGAAAGALIGDGALTALTGTIVRQALWQGATRGAALYGASEVLGATAGEVAATREGEAIDTEYIRERAWHGLVHGATSGAAAALQGLLAARLGAAFIHQTGSLVVRWVQRLPQPRREQVAMRLTEFLSQASTGVLRSFFENLEAMVTGQMDFDQWLSLAGREFASAGMMAGMRQVVASLGGVLRARPTPGSGPTAPRTAPRVEGTPAPTPTPTPTPTSAPLPTPPPPSILVEAGLGGASSMLAVAGDYADGSVQERDLFARGVSGAFLGGATAAVRHGPGHVDGELEARQQRLVRRGASPEEIAQRQAQLTQQVRQSAGDNVDVVIDARRGTSVHVVENGQRATVHVGRDASAWHLQRHLEPAATVGRAVRGGPRAPDGRVVTAARQLLQRMGHRRLPQIGAQARAEIRKLTGMVASAERMIRTLEARAQRRGVATPEEETLIGALQREQQAHQEQIARHQGDFDEAGERPIRIAAEGDDDQQNNGAGTTPTRGAGTPPPPPPTADAVPAIPPVPLLDISVGPNLSQTRVSRVGWYYLRQLILNDRRSRTTNQALVARLADLRAQERALTAAIRGDPQYQTRLADAQQRLEVPRLLALFNSNRSGQAGQEAWTRYEAARLRAQVEAEPRRVGLERLRRQIQNLEQDQGYIELIPNHTSQRVYEGAYDPSRGRLVLIGSQSPRADTRILVPAAGSRGLSPTPATCGATHAVGALLSGYRGLPPRAFMVLRGGFRYTAGTGEVSHVSACAYCRAAVEEMNPGQNGTPWMRFVGDHPPGAEGTLTLPNTPTPLDIVDLLRWDLRFRPPR